MTKTENSGVKVLVVEDSRTQAEYLQHILENAGYHVVLATNGSQALEKIKIEQPAIVLTDIIMPEMDGYELCRAIKQNKNFLHIPVILVTQLFDPADLIKGLEAGADNIIIKPFEPKHVISRITTTLQSPGYPAPGDAGSDLEVSFDGRTHHIPANQLRTPAIILSTYDLAVRKNTELQEANERLAAINEELQQRIDRLETSKKILSTGTTRDKVTDYLPEGPVTPEPQKQARKTRGDEERFRMITELAPVPISIIDNAGNYRFLNRKFVQLFGYTLEDIPAEKDWLSKAFRDNTASKNLIQTWKEQLEGAGETKISPKFPVICKNGKVRQISIHPIVLARNERVVIYKDITDKAESDRLRSVLASIVNSSNDAIIGKNLDGTIMSWNKAAERYYGYLAEEVIGKSIEIIIPPELRVHLPLFLQRVANGENIDRFDTIRLRKDGSRIEVCVTLSPIWDENNRIIGISTIAQNVAERKKYEVSRMFNQQVLHRR